MEEVSMSSLDNSKLEGLAQDILSDLVEDACLGLCFDVHRAVKQGYFFLDDTDQESMRDFEIVDQPGLDVFGQVYNQWKNKECVCPNCSRSIAASRFAPHLEKCLGMGRNSSRIANRRIVTGNNANNKSESDQEDNDDVNDNDWSYGAEKKAKKRKSDKNPNSPRRSKSFKHKSSKWICRDSAAFRLDDTGTGGDDEQRPPPLGAQKGRRSGGRGESRNWRRAAGGVKLTVASFLLTQCLLSTQSPTAAGVAPPARWSERATFGTSPRRIVSTTCGSRRMALRGGFTGPPMNPSANPMNVGHSAGTRMSGMPQAPAGYPRGMGTAHQYLQRPGMPPNRIGGPMGSMGSQLPGPSYGNMPMRPGMGPPSMDASRKRFLHHQHQQQQQQEALGGGLRRGAKRRKMADKVLPQRIRDLVPESQAYMDLLAFERKLDQTIARKRMEIQEAIKKPIMQKRKLRIYISNTYTPCKPEGEEAEKVSSWELRVEGKLLEEPGKQKRKFSSFFKSLVIELDKELYGPDNHLVEWHRMATTQETDGFQVKRPGDVNVKCTLLLMLDHQPPQYKLDPRLARLLGVHTQTRASIMQALWLYIKNNKLQDGHEKEYINCNRYFRQIFGCPRMRFSEIPMKLAGLLQHPDPIIINHVISVDPTDQKKTACYDIDVEVDDPLKGQMNSFLSSTTNQQEIAALEMKIHETIEYINQLKTERDFMLSFSNNPQDFIQDWLKSQSRDLKLMTDVTGNPEEERKTEFYQAPWVPEAVGRYVYSKVQQRRQELEQVLGIRLT
ncbi:putative SWI/SNF-related matrix-associated actin-dependent regulator of chromatin subfamily D member 2-like [Scophthalmus maximus]|uniref:Ataxin-7-like protein 3 n=2 Tax=Scophthalmus maximus TaxID=52904 RepID=A0A2U9CM45_SCOMX|nr:putative SWI/SNF-related matrix-associated actin-dependent regulator of chromatin subfamily D member 2-like [Scophthalmus maximus]